MPVSLITATILVLAALISAFPTFDHHHHEGLARRVSDAAAQGSELVVKAATEAQATSEDTDLDRRDRWLIKNGIVVSNCRR